MLASARTRQPLLERVDQLPPWQFTATLWVTRWPIVLPAAWLSSVLFPSSSSDVQLNGVTAFGALVIAPVLETAIECALPYWAMNKLGAIKSSQRPWGFIAVSAALMALLHLAAWPAAILPSLITGAFLAYVYAHFAPTNLRQAFLHTVIFHAAINVVGLTLMSL